MRLIYGTLSSPYRAIGLQPAIPGYLATYGRWRAADLPGDRAERKPAAQAAGDNLALVGLKGARRATSRTRCYSTALGDNVVHAKYRPAEFPRDPRESRSG